MRSDGSFEDSCISPKGAASERLRYAAGARGVEHYISSGE